MSAADGPVAGFCQMLHDLRELRGGLDDSRLRSYERMLAEAVQAQCREHDGYDPGDDRRVQWAREVMAAARRGEYKARALAELEALVEYLLGPPKRVLCGKDLGAGE
jgi:hypothetical protein